MQAIGPDLSEEVDILVNVNRFDKGLICVVDSSRAGCVFGWFVFELCV